MSQTILIHDVVNVETTNQVLNDDRVGPFGVTRISVTTADGSTVVICLFDAKEDE